MEMSGLVEAVGLLAEQMQEVRTDVGDLKTDVGSLKTDVGDLKTDVGYLKSQMVTKSYLDDKLANLRGDLIALCRKSNTKLSELVGRLVSEGSLKQSAADVILAMEPFAQ